MSREFRLALTGWPLAHSLSPHLHKAALQAFNLAGHYSLYPIPPLPVGQADLAALLERLRRAELHGLNITIPHKQAMLPFLDRLAPTAQAVGAVNTIYIEAEQLVGENTDVQGFWQDLNAQFDLPERGKTLILGAGGAARACVYALARQGWQVHVSARRPEQARSLTQDFSYLNPAPLALEKPLISVPTSLRSLGLDLLVNTTPLGMPPYEHLTPWEGEIPMPPGCAVYDLVYNPPETPLLRQAAQQGLPCANGLGMLVHQAALSFILWTGLPADRLPAVLQAMRSAVSPSAIASQQVDKRL